MKNKIITAEQVMAQVKDGASIMIGGFFHAGEPNALVEQLLKQKQKDLTIISLDAGNPNCARYYLFAGQQVKKAYLTHVGYNPHITRAVNDGLFDVELVPQGTMAERIRCAGAGLGGVLTPTGVGTAVQEGKQVITVDGKPYLLELPLRADYALIYAQKADTLGNLVFHGSAINMNQVMATAGGTVIAQVEEIVQAGELNADSVDIPCIFVDYIVQAVGYRGEEVQYGQC